MKENYQYPLDMTWSIFEMETVIAFFNQIEKYYEAPKSVSVDRFLSIYSSFKKVVPSKAQEKQIDHDFEVVSGYSIYQAVQTLVKKSKI